MMQMMCACGGAAWCTDVVEAVSSKYEMNHKQFSSINGVNFSVSAELWVVRTKDTNKRTVLNSILK